MTIIASMAVLVIASALGQWINDHTNLGGDYLSDEELRAV